MYFQVRTSQCEETRPRCGTAIRPATGRTHTSNQHHRDTSMPPPLYRCFNHSSHRPWRNVFPTTPPIKHTSIPDEPSRNHVDALPRDTVSNSRAMPTTTTGAQRRRQRYLVAGAFIQPSILMNIRGITCIDPDRFHIQPVRSSPCKRSSWNKGGQPDSPALAERRH